MCEKFQEVTADVLDRQRLKTFLLGGIAGALAGIVFTPRSGRELRGSVSNRAGEARERSREALFDAQERLRERLAERSEGFESRSFGVGMDREAAPGGSAAKSEAGEPDAGGLSSGGSGGPRSATDSEELRERIRATRERLGFGRGGEDR